MRSTHAICTCLVLLLAAACTEEEDDGVLVFVNGGGTDMGVPDMMVAPEPDMMVEPPEPILVPEFGRSTERQIRVHAQRSDGLSHPRDLEFDPESPNDLWVVDRDWDGNLTLFDAGRGTQRIERMHDKAGAHFMEEVSGVAFSDRGSFATCQESRNGWDGFNFPDDFMGPALWSTDLMIHCIVNQARNAPLNGSHLDMLHQSPLCMGITHESGHSFFVTDGANGHVVRYDFREPHVPGGDDHSDGRVSRFPDLIFTRVPDVPSHLFLVENQLYYADTGTGTIRVADMSTGEVARELEARNEPLALYNEYEGVSVRVFADGLDEPSGLLVANDRVFVTLPKTGEIVAYGTDGVEIQRIDVGPPGVMGLAMGPAGRLWFVNAEQGTVSVIDPGPLEMPAPEMVMPPRAGDCVYPESGSLAEVGRVMPPFSWGNSVYHRQSAGALSALDMFCGEDWQGVDTIVFVVITQWVKWVDEYVEYVDALAAQIEEAGGRVVYVGAHNARGELLDSMATDRLLNHFSPQRSGIRVGAADSNSTTRLIDSGLITHMPSAFVVRRSDMMVLATQRARMTAHLPYVEMAQDPTADWSDPGAPTIVPVLPSNCDPGEDEDSEPNDSPDTAATIGAGTFTGGVCTRRGDFYQVNMRGDWALDLVFSHEVGDLDIALFNGTHRIRDRNGNFLGASTNSDDEHLEWTDPILVYIYGHEQATAPYELTIRAR